jgi:ABC-2 type transport system ATP-binding protein
MIEFRNCYKTYRTIRNKSGIIGALKGLFFPEYRYVKAINNLTFSINKGELVGLIGENGAGKSTTVKLATGILRPDRGHVFLNNLEISKNRQKCAYHFGVTFGQRRSLWWQLSARDGMEALGRIYNVKPNEIKNRVKQLVGVFELEEFIDKPVRHLSLGQRVRCEVTSCFIHRPRIVFLDEPTIGMDALAKIKMREYLKRINRDDGVAVLLTSHDLFDVERVCNRIIILDKGNLVLDGSLESIRKKFGSLRILNISLASPANNKIINNMKDVELLPVDDNWKLKIRFNPSRKTTLKLIEELQKHINIADYTIEDLPIDEFVAEIYKSDHKSKINR